MKYTYEELAKMIDHSLLHPTMTDQELEEGCRLAAKYGVASVCIKPYAVKRAAELLRGSGVFVGAVIGFPHGNSITESKRYETQLACKDGAVEIDMVINLGKALGGDWDYVERDVKAVCDEAHRHDAKVKVIFENDYLTKGGAGLSGDDFKKKLCQLCEHAGADWVKTSSGYGFVKQADGSYNYKGATEHDLALMRASVSAKVQAPREHSMNLKRLVERAADKTRFQRLEDYIEFARAFLDYTAGSLQAVIVSRNEPHYNFWQYREEGTFNVTRPINSALMFTAGEGEQFDRRFLNLLAALRESSSDTPANRACINRSIYTLQQCIGAALDALPASRSNTARKINGDLFERLISLVLVRLGIDCTSGTVKVPIEIDGSAAFTMSYQHDLIIKERDLVKAIGSVKTSSKDRLDKVFVDKFLFNRLTGVPVPHFAIFLNDVQRKGTANPPAYGINATFLPGHFKGYTIKLNPLDGVYYCDIRPTMQTEPILRDHIKTFDHFLFGDIWALLNRAAIPAAVEPGQDRDEQKTAKSDI